MSDPLHKGPYRIIRRLAAGGMGEVLLAESSGDDRVGLGQGFVVIKRTLGKHPNQDHHNNMLREEGRISLRLRHANLVETFALDQVEQTPILVMEYLAGRSMAQVLGAAKRKRQMLPVAAAVKIIHQSACGLHFAHTLKEGDRLAGLVHRDVSPANIFVTFDGRIKVIDFGVAKADDSEIKTSTGVIKGKIGYMSPEHTLGEKLDPRSDLWSLGVLLWEALVAERLFASQNPALTLHRINSAEISPPSAHRSDVPPAVDELVMHLLARDKAERVGSGAELVRLIERIDQVNWREIDLGDFLMRRFPEEAALGQQEAARAARIVSAPPVPEGLVIGHAAEEGGIDEEEATHVANSRDLIELARQISAEAELDEEDHARTVQMSAAQVAELTGQPSSPSLADPANAGPSVAEAHSDDDGKTEVLPGGSSSVSIGSAINAQSDADDVAPDVADRTLQKSEEEIRQALEQMSAEGKAITGSEAPVQAASSGVAPLKQESEGQQVVAPAASTSGLPALADKAHQNSATPAVAGPPSRLSAASVALGTFGLIAALMGGLLGFLQPPRDPLVVAWKTATGAETVAARIDAPSDKGLKIRRVDLERPWVINHKRGGAVYLDKQRFASRLNDSGVWSRAQLPTTTKAKVSAALPSLFLILGLFALAWAIPAYIMSGVLVWAFRLALVAGCTVLGGAMAHGGSLGWPGFKPLQGAAVQIPANQLAPPAVKNETDDSTR